MICVYNTYNTKHDGFGIYYRSSLPYIYIYWLLHEFLTFELQIGNKIFNFLALYKSRSQSQYIFETFADSFKMTLQNSSTKNTFLITATGDFDAKFKVLINAVT